MNFIAHARFLVGSLFLFCTVPVGAPVLGMDGGATSLTVDVRGPASRPVANVELELVRDDAVSGEKSDPLHGTTGDDGRLVLEGLAPGRYRLRIQAGGFVERVLRGVLLPHGAAQSLRLDLTPGFIVEGKVLGEAAKGLEGARVCVRRDDPPGAEPDIPAEGPLENGRVCATSSSGGRVEIRSLPSGRYVLTVAAPGRVSLARELDLSRPLPPQEWRLRSGGSIAGRVVGSDGGGVARVRVVGFDKLRAETRQDPVEAHSDAEGRFLLKGLAPGSWRIRIEPEAASALERDGIEVREGETTALGELRGSPGSVLEGIVLSPKGEPLPGAELRIHEKSRALRLLRGTKTDREGRFHIGGLPATEVDLIVVPPQGYAPVREERLIPPRKDLEIVVDETGRVRGTVRADGGALPTRVAISSRTRVSLPGVDERSARTADVDPQTGGFLLEGVTPGHEVEIRASAAGFWCESVKVAVEPALESGPLELTLRRGVGADGLVTDRNGAPLAGVTVGSPGVASSTSDSRGEFRLEGLRPGTVELTANHPDFAATGQSFSVPLPEGERAVIQLGPGGTISGAVTDQDGAAVEGVVITLGDDPGFALTDIGGRYRIERAPAGSRTVVREGSSRAEEREVRRVDVVDGGTATVDFRLGGSLKGRVTRGGAPVAGAFLSLSQPGNWQKIESPADYSTRSTFTDENGRFALAGAPSGWATICIQEGTLDVEKIVEIPTGRVPQLEIALPDRPIRGRILAAKDDQVIVGARVLALLTSPAGAPHVSSSISGVEEDSLGQNFAFSLASESTTRTSTDRDGGFMLFLESEGKQSLMALARGYGFESKEVDPDGREPVTLRLRRSGKLRIRLGDLDGRPVSASEVCIWGGLPGSSGGCGLGGPATVETTVTEGHYTLIAGAPGFAAQVFENRETHIDPEGRPEEFDLKLEPGAKVTFRLSGVGAEKARIVSLKDPARHENRLLVRDESTDPSTGDKRWFTWPLGKGEWEVTVDVGDGKTMVKTFSIAPGADVEVLLP